MYELVVRILIINYRGKLSVGRIEALTSSSSVKSCIQGSR